MNVIEFELKAEKLGSSREKRTEDEKKIMHDKHADKNSKIRIN